MNETPPDDDSPYGEVEQIDTNPGGHEPAQLQGICFGALVPRLPCVLIRLQVRVTVDGKVVEGARDPMMIAYSTLKELSDNLPLLLEHMSTHGADTDRLPLPALPLPAWNEGPSFTGPLDMRALCVGFGFLEEVSPTKGAAMAYIEIQDAARNDEVTGGSYIVGRRTIVELQRVLPKVLRKMVQKGHEKLGSVH